MEKYMENLRKFILKRMGEFNYTLNEMSIRCDISSRRLSDIVRGEAKDISLSTLVKICENANIPYSDIFDIQDDEILGKELKKFYITNGKMKFKLEKV